MKDLENPFTPGRGEIPTHWAYHGYHLKQLRKHLDRALSRTKGAEAHLHGPRGCGKTAMLRQIASDARRAGAAVVTAKEMAGGSRTKHRERLKKAMRGRSAAVLVDNAHKLPSGVGNPVFPREAQEIADAKGIGNAFHAARGLVRSGHPLLLVVAGTPFAWKESPWNLDRETPEVVTDHIGFPDLLSVTAERAGAPFDDAAAALLARDSGGNLRLLQELGCAAWEAARTRGHKRVWHTDAELAARLVVRHKAKALTARIRLAAHHMIALRCVAVAQELLLAAPHADNLKLDLLTAVDPGTNPHDLGFPEEDMGPVLVRFAPGDGLNVDDAMELMTRLGLFHIETGLPQLVRPSYPGLCEQFAMVGREVLAKHGLDKLGNRPRAEGPSGEAR